MTMNENINLTKILKDCPKGTKLYSLIHGHVEFSQILNEGNLVIEVLTTTNSGKRSNEYYTFKGQKNSVYNDAECVLFPSKEQRDWSKFTAPWYKKEKFDPKTLKAFDRVLVKSGAFPWRCDIFSYYRENKRITCFCTSDDYIYDKCIPYNDETKHLVGTNDEAPEYYRYWED